MTSRRAPRPGNEVGTLTSHFTGGGPQIVLRDYAIPSYR